jgi:predicted metal-dependent phosphoesterase TrpH
VTAARSLAVCLGVVGLSAGAMLDRVPGYVPSALDGYYVLAADFHVHAFIGDGALAPWQVPREARRRGLDVIVITNHNHLWGARAVAAFATGLPIVIVGQEITAPRFHIAAAGLSRPIAWDLPARETIDAVHAQGAVAIAAHPTPESWRDDDEQALAGLDGTEVAHPGADVSQRARWELRQFRDRVRRVNPDVAPIGSSDFHYTGEMGHDRTFVLASEVSEAGVLDAVRQGRTVASDAAGKLIGDPALVAIVERHLAAHPRPTGPTTTQKLAAAVVLVALAALVLLR